ncbi:hypothetical protein [Paenibacillus sp. AR247]|uniref:hypothetical protein n=1 Tax=Paenibacillus sp. AR247 TaxID=1631599 RepID=UPI000CFA6011|nr:hypothetical protein [Paenibacillus sp. AR247]PQP89666.1 hypothetical protein CPT76_16860 [Paenibacillus sp. AR247]
MGNRKAKAESLQDREVITSELAAIVGKTPQWIRQLTRDGVLKQVDRGKYLLGKAVQAYCEHVSGGREDDKKPRFIDEKTEHERIKKEKAALELAEMQGELHRSEDVEAVMNDMLGAFRQRIRTIPMRLAPELIGQNDLNVIKGRLSAALDEALAELADYDPELFREEHQGSQSNMEG